MATLRAPLRVIQGTAWTRTFHAYSTYVDGVPSDPVDLAGYTMSLVVRRRQWSEAPEVVRADESNGRVTNNGVDGFVVALDAPALDVEDGAYFYWLFVWPVGAPERVQCWLHGPFVIDPGGL